MLKKLKTIVLSSNPQAMAGAFRRVGWIGFWLQVVLGVLPIILLFYVVFFSGSNAGQRESIALTTYLSVLGWLILFFTTFWSYRYTRLSKKMADPEWKVVVHLRDGGTIEKTG